MVLVAAPAAQVPPEAREDLRNLDECEVPRKKTCSKKQSMDVKEAATTRCALPAGRFALRYNKRLRPLVSDDATISWDVYP